MMFQPAKPNVNATPSTHDCPGCGTPGIPRARLSCLRCWYTLPAEIQARINETWRIREQIRQRSYVATPEERRIAVRDHLSAIAEASAWYRLNPLQPS